MTKRAHGEGSVRRQGSGYVASIMLTVDGERHRINRAGKTAADAPSTTLSPSLRGRRSRD